MKRVDPHYIELLSSGGDERSDLIFDEKHKYHLNPSDYKGLFTRGSCTCSSLNPQTGARLTQFGDYVTEGNISKIRARQAERLKNLFNYEGEDAFDVVFAPSGSDLAYIPILFSEILEPQKKKMVLLTCPEELGSGSQMAFLGKFFGAKNQFGDEVEKGEDINPRYDINLSRFIARSNDGLIINHANDIKKEINDHPELAKIGALVIGSKSGIEDDISLIPKIAEDVMWVVDLCQFRNSKKLVNMLLNMNCMVMITGSKFYMAPPFCGVMLVPKRLSARLEEADVDPRYIKGYDRIFSYHDFPTKFKNLSQYFPKKRNNGLTLRWEIAIDEMERFSELDNITVNSLLDNWNETVNLQISKSKNFELMPHQDRTNSTIISFKVKNGDDGYLEYGELRDFFKFAVTRKYDNFDRFDRIFFGQPVKYGYGAFIRLALGSNNIFNLMKRPEDTRFNNDMILVDLLDQLVDDFIEERL